MECLSLLHWQNRDFGKPSHCFVSRVKCQNAVGLGQGCSLISEVVWAVREGS